MNSQFVQRGGWWVIAQALLLSAVAISGVACRAKPAPPGMLVGGLLSFAISLVCAVAGFYAMGRNLTPFPKPTETTRLVRHGIYALIRHPLYTSVFFAALGWSLLWKSWPALGVSVSLAIFLDAKARYEEYWLRRQFPDYASYERQVRRFIPWIY